MACEKAPIRVLVVDDEPLIRWSVAETLRSTGCVVTEASDARQTIDQLVEPTHDGYDVIMLDYQLPDSDDLELLTLVKQVSPASAVVMMSAVRTRDLRDGALERGAETVLAKPFDLHDLSALVTRLAPRAA
jgi:DNA-binding response OmpR family regulator